MVGNPVHLDGVFDRLRNDILTGRLRPGERLRYVQLCEQYGTSMGVLRESLLRLADQGLVRVQPRQGFQVMPLSPSDVEDLNDAREEIEALVVALSVAEGDVAWEAQLIAAHHTLSRTPERDPHDPASLNEAWENAHTRFHEALLDGCRNHRLKEIASSLRDAAGVYRRWSAALDTQDDRDVAAEHAALLEAALRRNPADVAKLLRSHIHRTTARLVSAMAGLSDAEPEA